MRESLRRRLCAWLRRGLAILVCSGAACEPPLDTTRPTRPELTLGGEIFSALCMRIASQEDPTDISGDAYRAACAGTATLDEPPGPRLPVLLAERERFISAADELLPPEAAPAVGTLLRDMAPLYDDGVVQESTRALGEVLTSLRDSPAALAALERVGTRQGYRPLARAMGVVRPVLTYDRLDPLLRRLLTAIRDGGPAHAELQQTLATLEKRLSGATADTVSVSPTTVELAQELLLATHADFTDDVPRPLAQRDTRGVVALRALAEPWTDLDSDGLADLTPSGRFVSALGAPLDPPAPFRRPGEAASITRDALGRWLEDGELVYRYVDASETLLGAVLHETTPVLAEHPTLPLAALRPLHGLAGESATRHEGTFAFQGYDATTSPLRDLAHATTTLAERPALRDALALAEQLVAHHETEVAQALELVDRADAWGQEPAVRDLHMTPGNTFGSELLDLLSEAAAVPGLLEDVVGALQDPNTAALGPFFAGFMRHRDYIDYNPGDLNGPALGAPVTPVDRTLPDLRDNRSIYQRFLHLIHDANGARLCNKEGARLSFDLWFLTLEYPPIGGYAECELFEVDNMAVFYQQSIIGRAVLELDAGLIDFVIELVDDIGLLDDALESQSGITGFSRTPTPQAINRMIFAPRNDFLTMLIEPPLTFDGASFEERHPGTIFAWETPGFYTALSPFMRAFDDHGRLDLFADLMSIMHRHYATPASDTTQSHDSSATAYSKQSGMAALEPLTARIMDEGAALDVVGDAATAFYYAQIDTGAWGEAVLAELLRELWRPERSPGLARLDGVTTFTRDDGTVVPAMAPWWLFAHAGRRLDAAFDAFPRESEAMREAGDELGALLLALETTADGPRFAHRRLAPLLGTLLRFARERVDAHDGEVAAWAAGLPAWLQEGLEGPLVGSVAHLVDRIAADPEAQSEVELLLWHLLGRGGSSGAFDDTLIGAVDVLQLARDDLNLVPLLRALAPAFVPERGAVARGLRLADALVQIDPDRALVPLLGRLMQPRPGGDGETVLEALVDICVQVNRAVPGASGPLTQDDYEAVLTQIDDTLRDPSDGLERLFELIENR